MELGKNLEMDFLPYKAISGKMHKHITEQIVNQRYCELYPIVSFVFDDLNWLIPTINEIR